MQKINYNRSVNKVLERKEEDKQECTSGIEVKGQVHIYQNESYNLETQKKDAQEKAFVRIAKLLIDRNPDTKENEIEEKAIDTLDRAYNLLEERYSTASYGTTDISIINPLNPESNILEYIFVYIPIFQSFGDTLGYKNGDWEFNNRHLKVSYEYTAEMIYEFISLGGINDISMDNWFASDDTVLYLETYKVLTSHNETIEDFGTKLREHYLESVSAMEFRHPGDTIIRSLGIQETIKWNELPYDSEAKGNGACMRSGCIGIFYPGTHNRSKLIALATECSRITHNSATSILGSIATALFTAYAVERVDITHWPHKFLKLLNSSKIDDYIKHTRPKEYNKFRTDKVEFVKKFEQYINFTFSGLSVKPQIKLMTNPVTRIEFLAPNYSRGHEDHPGSCADDAVIFAYDALLHSQGKLEKLIIFGILNIGDSDTVGSIAMSWFGIVYFNNKNLRILQPNFIKLEYYKKICALTLEASYKKLNKIINYDLLRHYATRIITSKKH